MSFDALAFIPELPLPTHAVVKVRAALPKGWGTGPCAPRTALEAARLLQADGHRVCLVSDGDHTCITGGRPSLVDLP
ncbi:hypothetical protein [Streptomyces scabiei]|uniref:hypothetical protein n=1 Tax=Streptomyces scabiei TaxID=1930 RepID=UPI001B302DE1|nr:hypothetical protein [Streptomyces sp. LBUM 1475]QTU64250.1 hypothetical protein F3K22_27445 [Streptomyces sp. LBUM 1475]